MKRLLLTPVFLFLLGGCGFNPENPLRRDVVVESSNRDKYIVKDSSVEIQKYLNKYDYLELIWEAQINSILTEVRDPVLLLKLRSQQWKKNNSFPEKFNVRDYFDINFSELSKNTLKEKEIALDSLEGNHAILINHRVAERAKLSLDKFVDSLYRDSESQLLVKRSK